MDSTFDEALERLRGTGSEVAGRSEEHTSELQSLRHLVCRLLLEKKKTNKDHTSRHKTLKNKKNKYQRHNNMQSQKLEQKKPTRLADRQNTNQITPTD